MSDFITKLSELIDPEVMGDMVSARIPKKLRVAPFAKIDDTLQGVPGDTITVPAYTYIGDASDVAEGGINVVLTAHAAVRKFDQPDEAASYNRWALALIDAAKMSDAAKAKEWADAVLFANYETIVEVVGEGKGA